MSTAFEHFVAAEGLLASLLKRLPAYEPSPDLEARVLRALQSRAASAASAHDLSAFEPPAHMETDFLVDAQRIEQAQAARRTALLQEIAAGASPAQALGAPVSPPADAWLRQRADAARPQPARSKPRWPLLNWRDLGLATLAATLASVATHVYLGVPSATEAVELARQTNAPVHVAVAEPAPLANPPEADTRTKLAAAAEVPASERPQAAAATKHEISLPASPSAERARVIPPLAPAAVAEVAADEAERPAEAKAATPAVLAELKKEKADEAPASPELARKADLAAAPAAAKRVAPRSSSPPPRSCLSASLEAAPAAVMEKLKQMACGPIQRLRAHPATAASAQQWAASFRAESGLQAPAHDLPLELDPDVPLGLILIDPRP